MNWKSATALLALTFVGMGSLVYLLLRQEEGFKGYFFLKPSKNVILEVKIPKESLGIVMGRNGNTIKEIESQSNVKIYIKEEYSACGNYKICIIQGTPEDAQYAESLIHEIIVGQPLIETYEMFVPAQACGRIIGKNGDNIRLISRNSNAKIIIENPPASQLERKIIIKGTSEQISTAKFLIEQKVEDHFQFHSKIESHMSNRPLRNELKYILPTKGVSKDLDTHPHKERFIATGSNGLLDIYMSTVESPDRFWVQIAGPGIDELDKLIEQLTDYYTKDENKMRHKLEEVSSSFIALH